MNFSETPELCDAVREEMNKRIGSGYSAGYFSTLTDELLSELPADRVIQKLNNELGRKETSIMEDLCEIKRLLDVFPRR